MASRRLEFGADLAAGLAVALIVIPQGIAYALIAGMPPVTGIYASILPALVYAMIGTSTTQSVGPQSVTALLVATVLAPLAVPASGLYVALAGQLALMTGLVLLIGAALRAGALLEYLSRPVMSGFINGAVLLICAGQLDALLGLREARVHVPSALLGGVCLMLLLLAARRGTALGPAWMRTVSRLAPLAVLVGSVVLLAVPLFAELGIGRVGGVPRGLPDLALPSLHIGHARNLIVPALLVAVIVFLQSMASAQVLARQRGERIVADRELAALGAANLAASLSGGFPVSGSIGRAALSHAAGARSRMAGALAALFAATVLAAPTGWLEALPLPALAATIIAAVFGMFDLRAMLDAWRYDRGEGTAHVVTLVGVLAAGAERGIVLGIIVSMVLLLWRASHPPIVEVGRRPGSEHFRRRDRQDVETLPHVLCLRIDQVLFFANVAALRTRIETTLDERPPIAHVVLLMSAVAGVDYSAAESLRELDRDLARRGVCLHLAEPKPVVQEQLARSPLGGELAGRIHRSAALAWDSLLEQGVSPVKEP